jgi:hypothetical protein
MSVKEELEKQMTNNNMWDCADMPPMFSAKWNIDDSSVFYFFFVNFWYLIVYLG